MIPSASRFVAGVFVEMAREAWQRTRLRRAAVVAHLAWLDCLVEPMTSAERDAITDETDRADREYVRVARAARKAAP